MKKTPYIKLFESLYFEISSMPSCSAFGCTNSSERNENVKKHIGIK